MYDQASQVVTANAAKKSAKTFHYGNIISVLIPPFFVFWFGASMLVYAVYRHHPNNRVGYHTQKGAYHYYALAGLFVPVLTFASVDFFTQYWWLLWGFCILALIPISVYSIVKINSEDWQDVKIQD